VSGLRGQTSLRDRVEWDNHYIENWSPWLDLKILLKTAPALLGALMAACRDDAGDGASQRVGLPLGDRPSS
jgi:lipopolysaccharide/colanic/teichoic acid biosynthesis glycosyltransferase